MKIDDATLIIHLLRHMKIEIMNAGGEESAIVGMAIRPDVYSAWCKAIVDMMMFKSTEHIPNQIAGVHYVVFEIKYTSLPNGVIWRPEVTFFTDASVWRRFLQHTDD